MHVAGKPGLILKSRLAQIIRFLGVVSLLLQTACSIDLSIWSEHGDVLSGSVKMPGITSSAACAAGDKKVYLHQLNTDGTVDETPLATATLASDYSFKFTNLFTTAPSSRLFLKVDACGKHLSRPVTGMDKQVVSYTTSLVGLTPYVQLGGVKRLQDLSAAQIETLITNIETAPSASTSESMSEVYDNLVAGSGATQRAQVISTLGLTDISDLVLMVPPYIDTLTSPTSYPEMSSASHTVTAAHWYGGYNAAYEWTLNGALDGNAATYAFTPTKNSQGANIVGIKIGTNDGSGNIDTSRAILDKSYSVTVQDTFPAIAPSLTLTSASITNSSTATVDVATGASLVDCETFSTFAISESATSVGVSSSDFNRTCATNTTQSENYSLSMGDGLKTVYLWAKDAAGNISTTPTSITVTLDTTPPVLSLTVPTATQASTAMSLVFSATDATSSVAVLKLQYSADNTTFSDVGTLTATTSPFSYTPSASGYLRLYGEDAAGNSTTTTAMQFVFDNTPPNAPVITLTTATLTNNPVVGIQVADCNDTGTILITETAGAPSASNTAWAACSATPFVYNYTVVGEGAHTMYVWAKDVAGNISATSASTAVTLDTTPPTIAWTAPTIDQKNNIATTVTWTVQDIHTSTSQNTVLEYSTNAGANYTTYSTQALAATTSTQTFNYSWTTPNTTVTVRLRATATDAAGNQTRSTKDVIVEANPPVITDFKLADGATVVGLASTNAQLTVTASTSATAYMRLGTSDFSTTTDNGVGWMAFSAEKFSYELASGISGDRTVYAQVKNVAGILSATRSYTVKLETGSPPVISVTAPASSGTYLPGQTMTISWACSSASASVNLATKPISSIQYTIDDGLSYYTIVDDTNSNLAATGSYNWTIPSTTPAGVAISATTPIRVLVACKTEGGVITTALSELQNSAWQILIGDPGNLETGVHISAADISNSTGIYGDSSNNLYSGSRLRHAITKIDRQTGVISEWLGSMFIEGCPTSSVAKFTTPKIVDITGDYMTIVSGPCHTITKIKISDKSIVWNRTESLIGGDDRLANSGPSYYAYLKSGYLYFPAFNATDKISVYAYYELDLNSTSSTPKLIIGNTAACSTSVVPSVGDWADEKALPCYAVSGVSRNGWITAFPDRSKMFIWYRDAANTARKMVLTIDSATQRYKVTTVPSGTESTACSRGGYIGSDTSKIVCMANARSGSRVGYLDTSTNTITTASSDLGTDVITDAQTELGYSDKAFYVVSRDTNELFEVKLNGSTFTSAKIGGQSFLKYGNGSDPSQVAFTSIAGLAWEKVSSTVGYLYTRGIRHVRRMTVNIPVSGTPSIIQTDTGFGSVLNGTLNTFGTLQISPDRKLTFNSLDENSRYTWTYHTMTNWTTGDKTDLGAYDTLYNNSTLYDWGWTSTFLPDNTFYYTAYADSNITTNLYIYRRDTSGTTTTVAGMSGATGVSAVASPVTGTTVKLSRVFGMQADKNGDLLVFDGNKLRKITQGASPTIVDVLDFTSIGSYPTGRTWIDAVYDNDTDKFYMVANNVSAGVTEVYKYSTAAGFESISVSGLNLPGTLPGRKGKAFILRVTPLGLLMQDAYKRRILATPL